MYKLTSFPRTNEDGRSSNDVDEYWIIEFNAESNQWESFHFLGYNLKDEDLDYWLERYGIKECYTWADGSPCGEVK